MRFSFTPELRLAVPPQAWAQERVNIVSLERIKQQIGERWSKSQDSTWNHLNNLLRQRLAPTDFYAQLDATTVLICQPELAADKARGCCLAIAQDLHHMLFGAACTPDETLIYRGRLEGDAIEAEPIEAETMAEAAEEARPAAADPAYRHRFVPIWDAPKEAVTTYRCVSVLEEQADFGRNGRARQELAVTRARLVHATDILWRRLSGGDRFLAWIPLSYDVIGTQLSRVEIAAVCRGLPRDLRPYLIFEISDLPHGVPQSRLADLVGSVRPFCRGVVAQVPPRTASYGAYMGVGLHGIGISAAAGSTKEALADLAALAAATKRQRMVSFCLDVASDEVFAAARANGVGLVSGAMIGAPQPAPLAVHRLGLAEIQKQVA